jgi:pimeloyl-ACP methyl ester carboxylesterase
MPATLIALRHHLRSQPQDMLKNFYIHAGCPETDIPRNIHHAHLANLEHGLTLLQELDARDRLEALAHRTFVLFSAQDTIVSRAMSEENFRHIPLERRYEDRQSGHCSPLTQAPLCLQLVEQALRSIPSSHATASPA